MGCCRRWCGGCPGPTDSQAGSTATYDGTRVILGSILVPLPGCCSNFPPAAFHLAWCQLQGWGPTTLLSSSPRPWFELHPKSTNFFFVCYDLTFIYYGQIPVFLCKNISLGRLIQTWFQVQTIQKNNTPLDKLCDEGLLHNSWYVPLEGTPLPHSGGLCCCRLASRGTSSLQRPPVAPTGEWKAISGYVRITAYLISSVLPLLVSETACMWCCHNPYRSCSFLTKTAVRCVFSQTSFNLTRKLQ